MEIEVSKDQLHILANNVLKRAHKSASSTATVIALSGELGSGKTTFTQELAKLIGVKESVISPTFVIMKRYKTTDKTFTNLVHIDAYRLKHSEELLKLGWKDLFENKHNLIVIEWPEQVKNCIPKGACRLYLSHKDENIRGVRIGD